ncbi:hypothetical protein EG329_008739 [Mollisiaceae sp. DMI_Dod_QoI]|nr:hypothetical protein EG329_008739 [Helotiales sp. DMI_Dod_QoI]
MSPQLPTRKLGKNGPLVPAVGFGLMGLSAFYGTPEPDSERFAVLDRAYELGETFWDSADMYQDSEDLVGKWFKRTGKRDEIFLATKFGNRIIGEGEGQTRLVDSSPDEGKIKYLGLSEISADTLRRACKVHHIDAVQIEYSPFSIDIEQPDINLLKTCRELGVATIAYSPLGRGLLTGAYKSPSDFSPSDFRKFMPRFSAENFPKNLKLVDGLTSLAQKKGCTPGQLTLAWLLAQGEDIIPIPGTKKIKYLEENLGALQVKLSKEEEKEIRTLVEGAEVHGERYPEAMVGYLFASTPALEG